MRRRVRLGRVKRGILTHYHQAAQESPTVTRHLWRPTQVAQQLGSSPAAVVRALDALVENGFMRVVDSGDVRRRSVVVTARGERRLGESNL